MKKVLVVMCLVAVSFLLGSQVALAGNPVYANVKADAVCTVTGTEVLVDAGLIQSDVRSSGPSVSKVVFSLEQHFPNLNPWSPVDGTVTQSFSPALVFDLIAAGDRYDVTTQDYQNICGAISPDANAVRAVVQITVDNANPKRPGGLIHTGRCISFPNPCR